MTSVSSSVASMLHAHHALLAAIVESSDDAIVSKGLDSVVTSWNRSAERMFGYTAEEIIGRPVTTIIPRDRIKEETAILSRIVRGEKVEHFETERLTKDGRLIPVSLTISPVRDAGGCVIGASKVARDISERRAAEAQQRLLTAELDHRVKNTLALVISIAQQTGDCSASLADFSAAFEDRIIGLSRAHALLSRSRWRGSSLDEIVQRIVAPMCVDPARFQSGGDEVILSPNEAIGLAMIFQELTTNAIKYGGLRTPQGSLRLLWTRVADTAERGGEEDAIEILWMESAGTPIAPSLRKGYGSKLLGLIVEGDLRGKVSHIIGPEGLECRMRFPLRPARSAMPTWSAK